MLGEPLPHPDNRVTVAEETDRYGQIIARSDYTRGDNEQATMASSTKVITDVLPAASARDALTIQRFAHLAGGARMASGAAMDDDLAARAGRTRSRAGSRR